MGDSVLSNVLGFVLLFLIAGFAIFVIIRGIKWIIDSVYEHNAFSLLTSGFNRDEPIDELDIKLIYKQNVENKSTSYVSFLEHYQYYLLNGHSSEINNYPTVNAFIKGIIDREHKSLPYSGIDDQKQQILRSIEGSINDQGFFDH